MRRGGERDETSDVIHNILPSILACGGGVRSGDRDRRRPDGCAIGTRWRKRSLQHVAITIHNYRWRLGLAQGEARYEQLEKKLAAAPVIDVPTITMEGDANGAPHPDPSAYAKKFSGRYEFRLITGGIGHNLPQEAPQAFAKAVIDADGA